MCGAEEAQLGGVVGLAAGVFRHLRLTYRARCERCRRRSKRTRSRRRRPGHRSLAKKGDVRRAFLLEPRSATLLRAGRRWPGAHRAESLRRIGELSAVQANILGRPADARRSQRRARNRQIIKALAPWFRAKVEATN